MPSKSIKKKDEPAPRKFSWKLPPFLARLSRLEQLIVAAGALALLVVAGHFGCEANSAMTSHDAAARFAQKLRDLEYYARSHNVFVQIASVPATPQRPCSYAVSSDSKEIEHGQFPVGVFVTGEVTFDPQGVPTNPSEFSFSSGKRAYKVQIDVRGNVLIQ